MGSASRWESVLVAVVAMPTTTEPLKVLQAGDDRKGCFCAWLSYQGLVLGEWGFAAFSEEMAESRGLFSARSKNSRETSAGGGLMLQGLPWPKRWSSLTRQSRKDGE